MASENLTVGAFPTATFPCDHLGRMGTVANPAHQGASAKGGPETAVFACDQFAHAPGEPAPNQQTVTPAWAPNVMPSDGGPLEELRRAVREAEWESLHTEGKTTSRMQPEWSASQERCDTLRCFCSMLGAKRVLEVGSFCGVASLAMAEMLPADGQVVALELDAFAANFALDVKAKSPHFSKISVEVGPAGESLERFATAAKREIGCGGAEPFDLVVIDADKTGTRGYFDLVWGTPGMLSPQGTVCLDVSPYKGQPPDRYVKFGHADKWVAPSGGEEIDAFCAHVRAVPGLVAFQMGGLLVARRGAAPVSMAAAPGAAMGEEDDDAEAYA